MTKDSYYFKHDCNARNDQKLVDVRRKHGMAGYGVYFCIIEIMRETTDYALSRDYYLLEWELHVDAELIRSVVEDFGLFELEDEQFYSVRLREDMDVWNTKKAARREAGIRGMQSRWGKNKTSDKITDLPTQDSNAITEQCPPAPQPKPTDDAKPNATKENDGIDYKRLAEYWNEKTQCRFGRLLTIENNRRKMVRARIASHGKQAFVTAIDKAASSEYLASVSWFNFDWMIRPNNFDKLISGNYDKQNSESNGKQSLPDRLHVSKTTTGYYTDF